MCCAPSPLPAAPRGAELGPSVPIPWDKPWHIPLSPLALPLPSCADQGGQKDATGQARGISHPWSAVPVPTDRHPNCCTRAGRAMVPPCSHPMGSGISAGLCRELRKTQQHGTALQQQQHNRKWELAAGLSWKPGELRAECGTAPCPPVPCLLPAVLCGTGCPCPWGARKVPGVFPALPPPLSTPGVCAGGLSLMFGCAQGQAAGWTGSLTVGNHGMV